ncbi:MAG: (2Fe-2S)-binding protein [Pseudomonadota bacterium]
MTWRRTDPGQTLTILVNGAPVVARDGDSVALALLAAGHRTFGGQTADGPATPLCLMGVCFGCLCTINGRAGEQACLSPVREGLAVDLGETS